MNILTLDKLMLPYLDVTMLKIIPSLTFIISSKILILQNCPQISLKTQFLLYKFSLSTVYKKYTEI